MAEKSRVSSLPAPLVGLAAWLVPGAGYWLLGQRVRAVVVGVTIIVLFLVGLLIGGVRELEVPGYSARGKMLRVVSHYDRRTERSVGTRTTDDAEEGPWVLTSRPLDEIRAKPWSIPQIMAGPLDLLCSAWSLHASQLQPNSEHPIGARSHSRVNEIGVLYTAVAGMLNLLAIIDAAHRAG
jgi:hypothetical protein